MYNTQRDPNASSPSASSYSISRSLAFLLIGALIILWLMRHFFGVISISAGAK